MGLFIDNSIASVQLQLRGGWKNLFITTGVYALIIFVAMGLWGTLDPKHLRDSAEGWTIALTVLQIVLVLLFSVIRVNSAVRLDRTTEIIESHRLMPITGLEAAIGYIAGPAAGMIAIGIVNVAAGTISTTVAGLDPLRWFMANFIIFAFVAFACAFSAFVGFYSRALFNLVIVLVLVAFFSQGMLLVATPILMILLTPLSRNSIFDIRSTGELFSAAHCIGFIGQLIVGMLFLTAAARKFRRPDRHAFTVMLSLLLLAAWTGLNAFGIVGWETLDPFIFRHLFDDDASRVRMQFIASVLTSMLISLLPIAAAIRSHRQRETLVDPESTAPGTRLGRGRTTLFCAGIVCCLLISVIFAPSREVTRNCIVIAISIGGTLTSLCSLLIIYRAATRTTVMIVALFLFATWFIPLLLDVLYHTILLEYRDANSTPWSITAYGPIGTLLIPWDPELRFIPGLCCQLAITAVLGSCCVAVERQRNTRKRQSIPL